MDILIYLTWIPLSLTLAWLGGKAVDRWRDC
jgi:hypothetical protein